MVSLRHQFSTSKTLTMKGVTVVKTDAPSCLWCWCVAGFDSRFLFQGNKPWISLPRGKGIRLTIAEERDKRLAAKQSSG